MLVTLKKTDLMEALEYTNRAVSKKPQIEIVGYTHIECADRVKLTGYNFDLGIVAHIDGDVLQKGSCCFEGETLLAFIKKCSDETVKLTVDNNQMTVACGKPSLKLTVLDDKDFPILPEPQNAEQVEMENLSDKIKRVAFCAAENKVKPILGGVNVKIAKNQMTMSGCDGNRLALISESVATGKVDITIPKATLDDLKAIVGNEKVYVKFDKKSAVIEMEDITVYFRLLAGDYVNLSQLLAKEDGVPFNIQGETVREAIERLSVIVDANTQLVVKLSEGLMRLYVKTSKAELEEYITTDYHGDDITIGVNFRYFSEAFKDSAATTVKIKNASSVITLRDANRVQMIMPLAILRGNI